MRDDCLVTLLRRYLELLGATDVCLSYLGVNYGRDQLRLLWKIDGEEHGLQHESLETLAEATLRWAYGYRVGDLDAGIQG